MSMESFLFDAMMKGLVSAGLPCLMLVFAIVWLNKKFEAAVSANKEAADKAQLAQNQFIVALNAEREDRLTALETSVKDCEKDRFDLRERLIQALQNQQVKFEELLKDVAMLVKAETGKSLPPHSDAK